MRYKLLTTLGWFYIVLGVICNQWILGWLYASDGSIEDMSSKIAIWLWQAIFLSFGFLTLKKSKNELITNLNLLLWAIMIIRPLMAERMLRVGIAVNIKPLKSPFLYADYSNNAHWKLRKAWGIKSRYISPDRVHPLLGWSQTYVTEENPLGLFEDTRKQMVSPNPKLLFYGPGFKG